MGKTNDKKKYIIYMYTFPSGKRYIGKTYRTLKERQEDSEWRGYDGCPVLWKAIQKYGVNNIRQDILFEDYMTDAESDRLEMICIALFKTNCKRYKNPFYGYNCDDGGGGTSGFRHSEETKEKLRDKNIGKVVSQETREKQSKAQKKRYSQEKHVRYGTHLSEEHKANVSKALKGKYVGENSSFYGHHHTEEAKRKIGEASSKRRASEETRKKLSEAHKGRAPTNAKMVFCEELNIIFSSIRLANNHTGVDCTGIVNCCKGRAKRAGGYHWHYATEEEIKQYKIINSVEVVA